ncbi:uncharacterized protein BDV17DRAFT_289651 [Aspergillus undulatus]|uniref:uncharacterized protein n=1 Tax=Aspergillus undulatus TaxID=1810928 RepID=UPI003CCCF36D
MTPPSVDIPLATRSEGSTDNGDALLVTDQQEDLSPAHEEAVPKDGSCIWSFKRFSALMKSTGGKITSNMSGRHQAHIRGGPDWAGKTTLLGEITGQDLKVGHSMKSGTLGHQVLPAIIHGQQYLFVDTPGFGAEDLKDKDVFEDIMSCVSTLGQWVTIAGVMVVRDVRRGRLEASDMRAIRWLQCFCGPRFFQNITVVQTRWDNITEDDMPETRELAKEWKFEAFGDILFQKHVKGAALYDHGIDTTDTSDDCDWPVLEELDNGWGLYETEAAKCLFSSAAFPSISVLKHKAVFTDLEAKVIAKPKEVDEPAAPKLLEWQETPSANNFQLNWWEIAKEVAWTFWGFNSTGTTKLNDFIKKVGASALEKLKELAVRRGAAA